MSDALKQAEQNYKQAKEYLDSVGNDDAEAKASVEGWAAEVARLKAEEKKAKTKAKKEPKEKKPREARVPRETQNGIEKPAEGSKSGVCWGIIDAVAAASEGTPTNAAVQEALEAHNVEHGTDVKASRMSSAFRKWRKFHGIAVERAIPAKKEKTEPAEAAAE